MADRARYYNVDPKSIKGWIEGLCKIPQEFKDKNLKYYNEEVDINE